MQTFLPYSDPVKCSEVLDFRRLNKQRSECKHIINLLRYERLGLKCYPKGHKKEGKKIGYANHPIVTMWRGHEKALKSYCNAMIREWKRRGYKNTMEIYKVSGKVDFPSWWGNKYLHASHRSALLAKDPKHYSQFGWKEKPRINYVWLN